MHESGRCLVPGSQSCGLGGGLPAAEPSVSVCVAPWMAVSPGLQREIGIWKGDLMALLVTCTYLPCHILHVLLLRWKLLSLWECSSYRGPHLFPRSPLNQRLQTGNKISSCHGNEQLGKLILGLEMFCFFFKYLFHRWDTGMFRSRHRSTHICCCCCYRPCGRVLRGIQHSVFSSPSMRIYSFLQSIKHLKRA